MKEMKQQGRQGDVLIINEKDGNLMEATKKRLFGIKKKQALKANKQERLVLAHGEGSGHTHSIEDESAQLFVSKDVMESVKHLQASNNTVVTHEEHEAFKIAEGINTVLLPNEWRTKITRSLD